MLLPAALLVIAGSLLLAWLAGRRLPRPWNRIGAGIALLPPVAIVAAFAAGLASGWLGCTERTLWRSPTGDGRFVLQADAIACEGAATSYNLLVEEVKADGSGGRVRAIWRSRGSPVPVAVDYEPPASFTVRAHDGSATETPVPPARVTLEGSGLTPTPMWSFDRGKPI